MKVSVERTSNLERRMKVTVPADMIKQEFDKRLQKAAQTARMDGFRPGKIPLNVIKQRFGAALHHEAITEALQNNFYKAITQEKLNPAGMPKIELNSSEMDKDLEFTATFEVMPEIEEVKGLNEIKVEKVTAEVTDADVDNMFETLRKQQAGWKVVQRAAKNEDRLKIDFEGFMDGKPFNGGSANDVYLVLGSKRMIEGFEAGLVGAKADEVRELNLNFPADYQVKELADKAAMFKVTVKEVAEADLPEVNDEFAKRFGVADLAALRKEVRNNMERELDFNLKNRIKNQVMEALVNHNPVELPKAMVDEEIGRLKQQAMAQFGMGKKGQKLPELPDDLFTEQAKRRLALGLLLNKVMVSNGIKPDANRVKALAEKMASVYQNPEEVVKYYFQDKKQYAELEQIALEEQIVEKILEAASVTEKKMKFSEVIQNQAG